MGLLMSDVKHHYIRSKMAGLANVTADDVAKVFTELESHAARDLRDEGFQASQIAIERALDLRYAGQGYEITIPCDWSLRAESIATLRTRFDEMHKQMFGHTAPDEPVEIVSYRLRGIGHVPPVELPKHQPQGRPLSGALRETRKARFNGATLDCPVYQRDRLDVGTRLSGPAIIDQLDATTVIPPGQTAHVDEFKNILIEISSPTSRAIA
jgi:N-methylhydantoinase A